MNLGTRLKNTLDARGMTVTQFAKEASIPAQTIYALINRDSNKADMDILLKLLKALDTDFFTFMGAESSPESKAAESSPESKAAEHTGALHGENETAPAHTGTAAANPCPVQSDAAPTEETPVKVTEKIVERILVKEVPAQPPEGKRIIYVDSDVYDQVLSLAKAEGIEDEAVIAQVLEAYLELGFGYRQRPLRSILRDHVPKTQRPGDIDSFLL